MRILGDSNVIVLTLFPGIQENIIRQVVTSNTVHAIVLRSFGSGNAPQKEWLVNCLKYAVDNGIVVVNISQCLAGNVEMDRYQTGVQLLEAGVVSGHDCTLEATITKLMFLLGHGMSPAEVREKMTQSICGEITK